MSFFKYAGFLSAITVSTAAFAEGSATNLDLLGSVGFTQTTNSSSEAPKYNGYNLGASALFAVSDTALGSPVVGGGVNFAHTFKDDFSLIKLSLLGHAGFKFKATNELAIFALGNIGYSPVLFSRNSKTSKNSDFYFKNYSYGASLIGMYKVMPEISVGAGATYNFNYNKDQFDNANRWNELSANVYVAYSL
ncbi:MAG: hypothetical protein DCC88_03215 [Spirobacillus cienkowskii]|jgi:hypothetical protein|uniref:Outer membrane protein beta-barrel domain-containing protein n=1 Tax=Spirobacillus cienkowskii TaxID=495820 RepID=A0A369L022_9BACT|nr:MAG: hypothetical protein DCC88_03215 [Spirobacillus cienkowskii]